MSDQDKDTAPMRDRMDIQAESETLRSTMRISGLSEDDFARDVLIRNSTEVRPWLAGTERMPRNVLDWARRVKQADLARTRSLSHKSRVEIPMPRYIPTPTTSNVSHWTPEQRATYEGLCEAGFAVHRAEVALKTAVEVTRRVPDDISSDIHLPVLWGCLDDKHQFNGLVQISAATAYTAIETWKRVMAALPPIDDEEKDAQMLATLKGFRDVVFHGKSFFMPEYHAMLGDNFRTNVNWIFRMLRTMRIALRSAAEVWREHGAIIPDEEPCSTWEVIPSYPSKE